MTAGGRSILAPRSIDLRAGQKLVLQDLASEAPGTVELDIVNLPATESAGLTWFHRATGFTIPGSYGQRSLPTQLEAGAWTLLVNSSGYARQSLSFELQPGEHRQISVALHPASDSTLVLEPESLPPEDPYLHYEIRGELEQLIAKVSGFGCYPNLDLRLVEGRYRIRVWEETLTWAESGVFEIRDASQEHSIPVVLLRD